MSNKTTKCRIREADNQVLKIVALKLSGEKEKLVSTAEIIDGLLKLADPSGDKRPNEIVEQIRPYI